MSSSTQQPSILILTPTYDGKVFVRYMDSWDATRVYMAQRGIPCARATRNCDSLVPRARIALLSKFIASQFSHALFIDGDIDWSPESVHLLLQSGKDVVCGVYPKKDYPISFPCNFEPGTQDNLPFDSESGCFRLKDAPTGFLMISRAAVERMIAAYPDRRCMIGEGGWDTPENQHAYDFFPCPIVNGMYQSEDFGFCELWRSIGGEVWVQPDITLGHSGLHRFVGCLADFITKKE